jgi:hypothetical protein
MVLGDAFEFLSCAFSLHGSEFPLFDQSQVCPKVHDARFGSLQVHHAEHNSQHFFGSDLDAHLLSVKPLGSQVFERR